MAKDIAGDDHLYVRLENGRTVEEELRRLGVLSRMLDSQFSVMGVRFVSDVIPMKVSVMCRDIAYAFPGQERGRFAACQAPEGGWVLARASDTGALPLT